MNCINQVTLLGRLGTDPEVINEEPLGVRFRVATNELVFSKKTGERETRTEWHNIKAWKSNAKFALDHLSTGDTVAIVGKIHYHIYNRDDEETDDGRLRKGRNAEIMASIISKPQTHTSKSEDTDI